MDGWNTTFLLGMAYFRGLLLLVSGSVPLTHIAFWGIWIAKFDHPKSPYIGRDPWDSRKIMDRQKFPSPSGELINKFSEMDRKTMQFRIFYVKIHVFGHIYSEHVIQYSWTSRANWKPASQSLCLAKVGNRMKRKALKKGAEQRHNETSWCLV